MMIVVTFLAFLSQLSSSLATNRACVPNTQFVMSGRICQCDNFGDWNEANCILIKRRADCLPGQIVWQGCSQCICQETGQLVCSNSGCYDDADDRAVTPPILTVNNTKDGHNSWECTPYKSYYINCSICVCPAIGKITEAHCAKDNSCQQTLPSSSDFLQSVNKNICIPNVMYLFPCLHCLCSDGGYFILDKCVETCQRLQQTEPARRCISNTFYRKNYNVCWCPNDSIPNDKLCTQNLRGNKSKFQTLKILRSAKIKKRCRPYSFLKRQCFYCGCNTKGNINEDSCLELDCLNIKDFRYDVAKTSCSPGEMVPICTECFCLRNGLTNKTYCSNVCSYQSKLSVLENVLKDDTNQNLVNRKEIIKTPVDEMCTPKSMYLDQGRYCLCPENGSTNFKLCTSVTDVGITTRPERGLPANLINENLKNINCTPNTFIEIDCNTCYCSRAGIIDLKWCTYDDCHAKRIIKDTHKFARIATIPTVNGTCVPGSVSNADCNFCICPDSSLLKDRVCTQNKCSEIEKIDDSKFVCVPLLYYLVDCNVCLCPRDGVKNVDKCTKKICEKTFLRSDSCMPGQFFSDDCNVCVCPPNGNKADKVCTNHRCSDSETPWKKIFRLSQNLLDNRIPQDSNRNLDVCFSGEEFEDGCKVCVCPDVGLRSFATCSSALCGEQNKTDTSDTDRNKPSYDRSESQVGHIRSRRENEVCVTLNVTSSEKYDCTPGSMYIIRCRQCICPYMGNINEFCRPLPQGTYCEQAFPGFNFLPMGRRIDEGNTTASNSTTTRPMNHKHTRYSCDSPGRVMDECFVCECEEKGHVIVEHCFKSDAEKCRDAEPSFLGGGNRTVS